jgi:chitodextrinase
LVACTVATGIQAQVPGGTKGKASAQLLQKMDTAAQQDLIVVYDDASIEAEAQAMQSEQGLSARHQRVIEHKVARYASRKQSSLSDLRADEVEVLKDYSHLPVNFVRVRSRQTLDRLLAQPGVVGVFEDRLEQKMLAQSLPLVGQPQVAAQGKLGAGTAVAVLDTGVDYTKAVFGSCTSPGVPSNCKVVYAQDFALNDSQLDNDGHGSNVAAIVAGVAPGTKIIALDVFGATGTASSSDILSAYSWVIANKATYNIVAMNLSLGGGRFTSAVTSGVYNTAVAQARAAGILTVAAAGNDGYANALGQPAAVTGVVSVGAVYDSTMTGFNWGDPLRCSDATSAADKVACFSNSASFLTLLAPGSQILAAGITQGGTSQAAPHVAGAVAVLRAAFPDESLDQTVARLTDGVTVTDRRNDIAKPRLNLPMALGVTATTCTFAISETGRSFDSNSATGSVLVSAGTGCGWAAASNASDSSWLVVSAGSSGSGDGTVSYSVAANGNRAERSGTLTVAGRNYTVTQSGASGTSANILLNPGFESGPVFWTDQTANGYPVITSYLNPTTTSNNWYAWLCGYNNCSDTIYQDITVPADAQNAHVQFNYWIDSDETSSYTAYDSMTVRIYSPVSASTYKYWSLSNLNATAGWVQSPQYDVSAYKGQTIRLQFSASTDASFVTNFFVDDVNLMVSGSVPDTQPPTVPAGLSAVAINTSTINLTWSAATDNVAVSAYKLYRDSALLAVTGNVQSYSDTGLAPGSSHSYTVAACDTAGNCSAQSLVALAVTPTAFADVQAPTVPGYVNGYGTSVSTISISWAASTDNVGTTQYKVYRNGTLLAAVGKVIAYADTGLTPSTTYSYTVSACDAAGNCSAQSLVLSVSTLSPFDSSTPIIIDGAVSVNWSSYLANISIETIANRSYYMTSGSLRIELWAFAKPFSGSELGYKTASIRTSAISGGLDQLAPYQSLTGLTLSLPFSPPPAGNTHYVVFVTEYSSTCTQADKFCYAYYVNLYEAQPPTVPTALTANTVSSSQINLAWTAATDNVGVATYKVYRNGSLVAVLGNVTSYSDVGLAAAVNYRYTVAACDAVGNCSAQSAATSATTPTAPDTLSPSVPSSLTATAISSSQVRLAWLASADNVGVAAYKIYSSGVLVDTLGVATSTTRATVASTTYRYTVAACDAVGNCSAQSVAAVVTTPALADTTPPSVPGGLTATAFSQSQINLAWTAATDNVGVAGYKVYRGGNLLASPGNVTNYSDAGLRSATPYSYTVQACDALGNCSAQSAVAATTTQGPSATLEFVQGWNLLGNSLTQPISVATAFGDPLVVTTVWKWDAANSGWQFYAPSMDATTLQTYATSKGYGVLSAINPGEGYWVNAKLAATLGTLTGATYSLTSTALVPGWNLVATGNNVTPSAFNSSLSETPPSPGIIPINLTTLWAWDATLSQWYFYAPSLEANGGLGAYTAGKGYLDFGATGKTLGNGVGFWVNRP